MDVIKEILSELLKVALLAVIPVLLSLTTKLVEAAFHWIEAKTQAEWLMALELEAENITLAFWQTMISKAKADLADGKISQAEWDAFKITVKDEAEKELGRWVQKLPERIKASLTSEKIGTALEAAVARLKLSRENPTAKAASVDISPVEKTGK